MSSGNIIVIVVSLQTVPFQSIMHELDELVAPSYVATHYQPLGIAVCL